MSVFNDASGLAAIYFVLTFFQLSRTNVMSFLNLYDIHEGEWKIVDYGIKSDQVNKTYSMMEEIGFHNISGGSVKGVLTNNMITSANIIDNQVPSKMIQIFIKDYDTVMLKIYRMRKLLKKDYWRII